MCVKLPPRVHPTNTYTCTVTIALRVCGGNLESNSISTYSNQWLLQFIGP